MLEFPSANKRFRYNCTFCLLWLFYEWWLSGNKRKKYPSSQKLIFATEAQKLNFSSLNVTEMKRISTVPYVHFYWEWLEIFFLSFIESSAAALRHRWLDVGQTFSILFWKFDWLRLYTFTRLRTRWKKSCVTMNGWNKMTLPFFPSWREFELPPLG